MPYTGHPMEYGRIFDRDIAYAIKTKSVDVTDASAEVVAAVTGKRIVVLALEASAPAAETIVFKSDTTAISPTYYLAAESSFAIQFNPGGLFATVAGKALNATVSSAAGIRVSYIEV